MFMYLLYSGTCPQPGLPNVDYGALTQVNLVQPLKIHICMWIYLGVSFLWFISSITLITSKSEPKKIKIKILIITLSPIHIHQELYLLMDSSIWNFV